MPSSNLASLGMGQRAALFPLANLIAEYRFDEGSAQLVNNRANPSQPAFINLFQASEQALANNSTSFWVASGGVTRTDYAGTDPFGNNNATRIQTTATTLRNISQSVILPAGAHTMGLWVKSNTGADQTFRMSLDNTATFSSVLTAPAAGWVRVSYTASPGAGTTGRVIVVSDAAGSALDILIYGATLVAGSADVTYVAQGLDMALGKSGAVDTFDPAWNAAYLGMQGAKFAFGVRSVPVAVTQLSCYVVCRWTGTEAVAGYAPIINEDWSANRFGLAGEEGSAGAPRARFASATALAWLLALNDSAWHIIGMTYDGTTLRFSMDGVEFSTTASSSLSTTIQRLYLGNISGGFWWPGDIAHVLLYSTAHSSAIRASVVATLRTLMTARSITINTITKAIAAEGDSITDAAFAPGKGYIYLAMRAIPTPTTTQAYNFALSGSSLVNMNSRAAAVDAWYDAGRTKNILTVFIGHNDLISSTAATFVASLKTYCLARKATGYTILLCTLLPSTLSGFNVKRNDANTAIYGDTSFYDALCDFAANATMGPDAAAADTTLYSDGTHPTLLGQQTLQPTWQTAITALL